MPDDEQFEVYLKRFRPIAPEPVPTVKVEYASRRPLSVLTRLAAVVAALLIATVVLHIRSNRAVPNEAPGIAFTESHAPSEPLTMRSANVWLATASSFKAAFDDLAFRSQANPLPQGKQSAVAVLSKEKIRL